MDIYTNHRNLTEVLKNYQEIIQDRNHRNFVKLPVLPTATSAYSPYTEKITKEQDTVSDRVDFHYPSMELDKDDDIESDFGSITDIQPTKEKRYMFLQSQKVAPGEEALQDVRKTSRPIFRTQKSTRLSFIQKIPKTGSGGNRNTKYEERDFGGASTKSKINNLLKRYLAKLFIEKYNSSSLSKSVRPSNFSKFNAEENLNEDAKTKLFPGNTLWDLKNKTVDKIKKIFSLFTIVQFNHTICDATNSAGTYQGICYTAAECSTLGGTPLGIVPAAMGSVVYVTIGTCGDSSSQNCSYFESPNYPDYYPSDGVTVVPTTTEPTTTTEESGNTPDPRLTFYLYGKHWARQGDDTLSCVFNVNKLNDNISKMRIDFLDLELIGPTNGTCMDERLIISGQNTNNQIPVICGYNTGQHVYVDVSSLSGPLQLSVLASVASSKRFRIRVCQFEDSCLEPSSNCLQYYTGITGVISSFNYDQPSMFARSAPGYLNDLNYAICIRREEGYCSITYRNVVNGMEYPFQLVNVDEYGDPTLNPGQAGADIFNCPDDYIVIGNTRLCGERFNDGSMLEDFTVNADVTDTGAGPIVIPVRTDSSVTGLGFKLFYTQNPCITDY
ncbi:hypothetical protein NQ317_001285 [Molorchus minor]|uniref:CUB domain-containing protein n=1 Tax=Molorchus minor TaxID=1323400 RepID=A0ABQ9JPI5_9CUCU|nr:hypothetical protein NQ317_001285 [Molorchus minor]